MSTRKKRSTRARLGSLGRPPVAGRAEQELFWRGIAAGLNSEAAAVEAGVSQAVGPRLFRKAGGIPPAMFRSSAKPLSGRYLSLAEREEIALLNAQGHSIREIGRRLGRAGSTISRELDRNAATHGGKMGLSGDGRSVARRSIGPPPQADQACAQPRLAQLCGRTPCRSCGAAKRLSRSWSRHQVERPPAGPVPGSAMDESLEPRADCPALADRLPG